MLSRVTFYTTLNQFLNKFGFSRGYILSACLGRSVVAILEC